ncbi:MAG: transketolase [Planctomycetaceae bacterium]|nr:transketolase [Planctomycetaceae bacterium]
MYTYKTRPTNNKKLNRNPKKLNNKMQLPFFVTTPSEKDAINTIRTISMEAVQKANSGHPGTPMALAPLGYVLFNEILNYDPAHPNWLARDRFVLSVGHASMLLYCLLHLSKVKQLDENGNSTDELAVTLDAIKNFRQLGSRCAGHPEYGHVSGVEVTTGPLGAGAATSVGMAIAAKWLQTKYNKPDFELFNSKIYTICGDGDMMEGITSEAASLAGHLKLGNLCWFYDDNGITIEGSTVLSFSEDVAQRFEAYNWRVIKIKDINNLPDLRAAIGSFINTGEKPTLIITKSTIGYGSPNLAGSHEAHGAPLGEEEVKATKKFYGFDPNDNFSIDGEVYGMFNEGIIHRGTEAYEIYRIRFERYKRRFPELGNELEMIAAGSKLPAGWDADLPVFPADVKGLASRVSSGKVLNQVAVNIPWLIGGSADLAPSNLTWLKFPEAGEFNSGNYAGRNIHFGIREHAMASIANGITLSGLRAYCATFFVFSDYLRPAIRLSALMKIPTLYIFTHDSIGVGEDGPTHQPIEHLAAIRAIPNVAVFRPADANEVTEAYKTALQLATTPSVLVFSRQNLPTLDRTKFASASGVSHGGYVLIDPPEGKPEIILMASGSEVGICVEAYERLTEAGKKIRVVSLPCIELFERQPKEYKEKVLPAEIKKRIAVELGVDQGWHKYIGDQGYFIGMQSFGASAPAQQLLKHFGITSEKIIEVCLNY